MPACHKHRSRSFLHLVCDPTGMTSLISADKRTSWISIAKLILKRQVGHLLKTLWTLIPQSLPGDGGNLVRSLGIFCNGLHGEMLWLPGPRGLCLHSTLLLRLGYSLRPHTGTWEWLGSMNSKGWRDGPAVESTGCSLRGLGFSSSTHMVTQHCGTPVPGDP